jgi:ribulose 1,5-bisphosphate synthetase/thiazole synthase
MRGRCGLHPWRREEIFVINHYKIRERQEWGKRNGRDLPFLIAGGGIGGLVAAYALALKGFPVRVLEQSETFREVGAGISLGRISSRRWKRSD